MSKNWVILVGFALNMSLAVAGSMPQWAIEGQAQVCQSSYASLIEKLQASSLEKITVAYFDTPDFKAKQKDVSLRVRLREDGGEVTVKFRHSNLHEVPSGADCELDSTRDRTMPSCSWEIEVTKAQARQVLDGQLPLSDILSSSQETVIKNLVQDNILGHLEVYGPVKMERWKIRGTTAGSKWRLEKWALANGKELFEISYREKDRVTPMAVQKNLSDFMSSQQLNRCTIDISKTDWVLNSL